MKEFNKFYFENFSFDYKSLEATFSYSFDKEEFFEEKIFFNSDDFIVNLDLDKKILNNLLFQLHLALGISYYKLFPTDKLIIKSGFLKETQKTFWKKFYKNGLGEFMIKNKIKPNSLFQFENFNKKPDISSLNLLKVDISENNILSLLMWGGGKDSIVSSILLEKQSIDFTPFVFGKIDDIKRSTLDVLGKKPMLVRRELSANLFKLNKLAYYNGHVPITGIIAFVSLISAYLYNYKNIVLSNERSASEENTIWEGLKINHQYSKSEEFELDFRSYVKNYISEDINYYSLLRKKYEFEIASIFSKNAKKYFKSFSSCNNNFKIKTSRHPYTLEEDLATTKKRIWCCNCEKCSFVYLILSSFLEEEELISIFGENLFENKDLLKTFKGLIGFSDYKPFECVGTYEESFLSIYKVLQKYKTKINSGEKNKIPYILDNLKSKIELEEKKIDLISLEKKLLNS